jgi:multiple sugar transport system ATP-binding protein
MTMADKIVVLRAGVIEQVGSPLELYQRPCNTFVAGFIGSPKMNLLGGDLATPYGAHTIGIRPEHLEISTSKGTWSGQVGVSEHLGSDTFLHVQIEGHAEPITVRISGEMDVDYGATVHLTPNPDHIHRFDAKGLRQS